MLRHLQVCANCKLNLLWLRLLGKSELISDGCSGARLQRPTSR